MVSLEKTTPFFTLPLDLREQIYEAVLTSPRQGPQLLQSCREIAVEGRTFLFRRPVKVPDQLTLYKWLDQHPAKHFPLVTQLSLGIQDVDLKPILDPIVAFRPADDSPRLLIWECYIAELARLRLALAKLPNIQTLTIRAQGTSHSYFYRDFLECVLASLDSLCPKLLDLRLEGNMHHQNLDFLVRLEHLQSFSFDGFSSSSAIETATRLASLKKLERLSIVSQSGLSVPGHHPRCVYTPSVDPVEDEVKHAVKYAVKQPHSSPLTEHLSPISFFASEVLASLYHHPTLKTLSINQSHTPDSGTLLCLHQFLENSTIEHLELDWPNLNSKVLETFSLVPGSIRTLWVRAKSASDAFDILWSLLESRQHNEEMPERWKIPELKKIVLIRSATDSGDGSGLENTRKDSKDMKTEITVMDDRTYDDPATDDTDEANIARARKQLSALGVEIAWYTEG